MIDSAKLSQFVANNIKRLCEHFYQEGKREGHEWRCADVTGKPGNSFAIELEGTKAGLCNDRAGGFSGNFVKALGEKLGVSFPQAVGEIERAFGVSFEAVVDFNWNTYRRLTKNDCERLAKWRAYSPEFVACLVAQDWIRTGGGRNGASTWAFPIWRNGKIAGVHSRPIEWNKPERVKWQVSPSSENGGPGMQPLIIGKLEQAETVHLSESTWDLFSVCDKLKIHETDGVCAIATRGAKNAKFSCVIPKSVARVYLWEQNDKAGRDWTKGILEHLPEAIAAFVVATPLKYDDPNDWIRSGAGADNLMIALKDAKKINCRSEPEIAIKEVEPELTDEQLLELEKTRLQYYRIKDRKFPSPMGQEAFYGVSGDIVRIIEPNSEASKEALLGQLLVGLGNIIGRWPYRKQGARHYLNEFLVLIGETAFGRKGTSWAAVENFLERVDKEWAEHRVRNGYQSGEAIINAVRDPGKISTGKGKEKVDPGVADKRLLMFEEEFSRLLTVAGRQGNTLSATMRNAWDGKPRLYTEGKVSPQRATGAHISLVGHVTLTELLETLREVENKNGFSNRILWVATRRERILALPQWVEWIDHPEIIQRVSEVIQKYAEAPGKPMAWTQEGQAEWRKFYDSIKGTENSGIIGSIIARSDAHVLRLTMTYAILDGSLLMKPEHLGAAIAFWDYCKQSAQWALGEKTGNKLADKIFWALQREPGGMTRKTINEDVCGGNSTKVQLDVAFTALIDADLAFMRLERESGVRKPTERWFTKSTVRNS